MNLCIDSYKPKNFFLRYKYIRQPHHSQLYSGIGRLHLLLIFTSKLLPLLIIIVLPKKTLNLLHDGEVKDVLVEENLDGHTERISAIGVGVFPRYGTSMKRQSSSSW